MRTALLVLALVAACGPKPQKQCASTSAGYCVSGEVCDFNTELGCQVCACKPWDNGTDKSRIDTGPTPPPNAPGPPIPVH
jgi:hypothetical protein